MEYLTNINSLLQL